MNPTLADMGAVQAGAEQGRRIDNLQVATKFILAGKATVTLVSVETGTRFTYKVTLVHCNDCKRGWDGRKNETCDTCKCHADKMRRMWFVSVLTGPSNESDYQYIGMVKLSEDGSKPVGWAVLTRTPRSRFSEDAPSVRAFQWTLEHLQQLDINGRVEIWHAGFCGRCGRKLTVPSSIMSGFGPECLGMVS